MSEKKEEEKMNWAKDLKKEFKFVLLRGLDLQGKHQYRDIWAALTEVETEYVCQQVTDRLLDAFKSIQYRDDEKKFKELIIAKKVVLLDELKSLIPLTQACNYIKNKLCKEGDNLEDILFIRKNVGEPAPENKDLKNE
ncbi:hypothetical protein P3W45_000811 [Vairimorpha bombi]